MADLSKPLEYPTSTETGSDSTLALAIKDVDSVALDARGFLSPLQLLRMASEGARPDRNGELVGYAYNLSSIKGAHDQLRTAAAQGSARLKSFLCRQLFDLAIKAETKREEEVEAQFRESVLQVFRLADEDGSGQLEYSELRAIASSQREAEAILARLDADSDGSISEEEWEAFFLELAKASPAMAQKLLERSVHMIFERDFMNACHALFLEFDQDGSGQLELHEVLVMMGDDEQGRELLRYADEDGNNTLSLDEWLEFFLGAACCLVDLSNNARIHSTTHPSASPSAHAHHSPIPRGVPTSLHSRLFSPQTAVASPHVLPAQVSGGSTRVRRGTTWASLWDARSSCELRPRFHHR